MTKNNQLSININGLVEYQPLVGDAVLESSFLNSEIKDMYFDKNITVAYEAEKIGDTIMFSFNAEAVINMPCLVCNEMTAETVVINFKYVAKLASIVYGNFDCMTLLKDEFLLELPEVLECFGKGNCPKREEIKEVLEINKKKKSDFNVPLL